MRLRGHALCIAQLKKKEKETRGDVHTAALTFVARACAYVRAVGGGGGVARCARADSDDQGSTLLHWAARADATAALAFLLERQAAVDAANIVGDTPLHWAAVEGHVGAVLSVRARVRAGRRVPGNARNTDVQISVAARAYTGGGQLLDHGAAVNAANFHGNTALHFACFWRRAETAKVRPDAHHSAPCAPPLRRARSSIPS